MTTDHPTIQLTPKQDFFLLDFPDGHQREVPTNQDSELLRILRAWRQPKREPSQALALLAWPPGLRVTFHPPQPNIWSKATFWTQNGPPSGTIIAQLSSRKPLEAGYIRVKMDQDNKEYNFPPEWLQATGRRFNSQGQELKPELSLQDIGLVL